jgi:hypothetical protein
MNDSDLYGFCFYLQVIRSKIHNLHVVFITDRERRNLALLI